jgi:hypothetical protein
MEIGSMASHKSVILGSGVASDGIIATANKPLAVSTYCWSVGRSSALEASRIIKNSAGTIRSASIRLDETAGTGTFFIQLIDSATLPADGAVTILDCQKRKHVTGTDDYIVFDFSDNCIAFSAGLVVVLSSTEFTKTIAGSFLSITVEYK